MSKKSEQKKEAEDFSKLRSACPCAKARGIKGINASNKLGKPIVAELLLFDAFHVAESYHCDYSATHPSNSYCELVISPKLEKAQKEFAELLKSRRPEA